MRARKVALKFSKPGVGMNVVKRMQIMLTTPVFMLLKQNSKRSEMAMTTPVVTNRNQSGGEKMDMTTPVIQQVCILM